MTNIEMKVDKNQILTITVDLKQRHGKSASGKNTTIASTKGNIGIPGAESNTIGLNIYTKE